MDMKQLEIAVIPGDGIGKEVVPAALDVLRTIAEVHGGLQFTFVEFPWSCDYYVEHGKMMPDDGLQTLQGFAAIFLGAVGNPKLVPDHISLWGLLLKIRREFEQVINIRPAKFFRGLPSPLANPNDFDFIVVRENSEGEYSEIGGRIHRGDDEIAIQNAVFTRKGTERVMRYAFELAKKRKGHVTSATKSNGIFHTMPFWDEVFAQVKEDYPEVQTDSYHIDALAAFFVTKPHLFDVVVASNLFGDILTDLGGAIMGSIGIAPAANINLNGKYPSMFEPVHGSAPDIYGKGIANPIGQIWTAKLMLDHFGEDELGSVLLKTMEDVTADGIKTPDIGGKATTREVTDEICCRLRQLA
ncbi:tartrate dehydrogenase [Parageobacillus thermoglucosidasius]|uniref:tartrate dehydrogenase n=1 Tax=Parageobacillus thermoglucosidasius TaxID=1426 RepID=UPI000BA9DC62|nr:tartrate dehydrogenase [Parageobacillus thermoglucosidasius]REK57026.1 MAG: tartrate dehydrogenase [Geobacillus sp.]MED4904911.1 tartrate dehydrogenase [Parageobacillus thermoglucosidasius]MED4913101.1 tartrate dehydrogenase [Parageobacillus thermoglucosidasius]MED4945412.1 tartrate dehydrogenase [Parageobacillus thermoglucosidasius]MED4981143.1 tartrate dehydrogenase [Parageobacillus thermoglucosidasius]